MQVNSQPDPTPNWQQALNPRLVQRLWQSAQQPGLVRLRQAQALLTRHQKMTTGLPLAALAQRGGTMLDAAMGQVPIVYAQPMLTDDAPVANTTISQTDVHVHQAMPIAMPQPSTSSTQSTSEPMVIQRKMAPGAASNPTSPMTSAPPTPLPVVAPAMLGMPNVTQQEIDATRTVISPAALPVVHPAPVLPALVDGAAVNVSSSINASGLPIIRINTQSNESSATRLVQWASLLPTLTQAPSTQAVNALPVVREQPAPERATNPNSSMLPVRLPLVEASQTQNATGPNATNAPEIQRITPAPQSNTARQTSTTQPNQQNPLNVDEIVDKVHRKFLRRLTSEAERRGVRTA